MLVPRGGARGGRRSSTPSSSPTARTPTGRCAPARPATASTSCPASRVWHKVSVASGGESSPDDALLRRRATRSRSASAARPLAAPRDVAPPRRSARGASRPGRPVEPQARGSRRRLARASATCARGASGSGGRPRMPGMTAQQAKQVVKNALYRTIGETSTALRLRPDAQKTLSILMYHKVNDLPDNPTTVPVAQLRRAARAARRARLQRRRPRRRPRPLHARGAAAREARC